jgi:hypothetical protein
MFDLHILYVAQTQVMHPAFLAPPYILAQYITYIATHMKVANMTRVECGGDVCIETFLYLYIITFIDFGVQHILLH